MQIQSIHTLCNTPPFIEFEVSDGTNTILCQGYEHYCCDLSCNCQLVNIMIHEAAKPNSTTKANANDNNITTTGKYLTRILYGWRPYKHYVKERFFKSDCKGMVEGHLDLLEPKTNQNKAILKGFRLWLQKNKKQNDNLFAERYKQFRENISGTDAEMTAEDHELSQLQMHQIFESFSLQDFTELFKKMKP